MKNAIILHGQSSKAEYYGEQFPSMSNAHWLPWLQGQLLMRYAKLLLLELCRRVSLAS